ncbi:MAG: ABC transporter permease [Chloroflexota bacterium]|nr:MAG: ABC transporter permease [Chloroflexota bacterium]
MTTASPGPRRAGGLPGVILVMRREILVRTRSRVFLGSTTFMVALVVIGIVGYSLVAGRTTALQVGFSGGSQALEATFEASAVALGQAVQVSAVADATAGKAQVSAGTLDLLVSGPATSPTAVVQTSLSSLAQAALERAVLAARLTAAGLAPKALASVTKGAEVDVEALKPSKPGLTQARVVGLVVGILLWIALGLSGSQVAQGVVEEKATRIMEIILATIRPGRLLAGKVLGIGLISLVQMGLVAAAALIANAATHVVTTPALSPPAVLGYLVWFVLGFLFYAAAYASLAALVSRPEEVQSAIAPFTIFQIGAYLLAYAYLANPSNPLVLVASVLPPFAPILMAVRISGGDVPIWQQGLALILIVAAIGGLIWLAGRVYANSAMRLGARVRFLDAFRG